MTGSVVLGEVIQIQHVGGNVSVTLSRPTYRVEEFPAVPAGLPVAQARAQPSRLLLARYELVPFTGRAGLVTELSGWLQEAETASVRLIYGSGGQGKSRLAAQFARHHAAGWAVWQARQALPTMQRPARLPVPAGAAGLLTVVDYADRWSATSLQALITDLHVMAQQLPGPPPLRVLLLARAAGFWWEALEQRLDADFGIPAAAAALPSLGGEVDRGELFAVAWDHFAAALGVTGAVPDGAAAEPPAEQLRGPVLTVHMAALAGVDACRHGEAAPGDPARVSAYLLKRERAHWQQWHARAEDPLPTPPQVMGRAVYAATLAGPLPQAHGIQALARAQVAAAPDHARQILDDHRQCYPAANPATVLEPLYPDQLGEDFLALTTPGQPPNAAADLAAFADAWAAGAIPALLAPVPEEEQPAAWAGQTVTVLIETARRWPHIRDGQLYPLLRARPQLALQAGAAALTALTGLPDVDVTLLEAIEARTPTDRHVHLDIGIAALTARLAEYRLAATSDPADHARIHDNLAVRLHHAGVHQQALTATSTATQTWRRLTATDRLAYLPGLAGSVSNHALLLAEVGRRAEAVPVSEEAVALYRELAALNRDAYLPGLAAAVTNHAVRLAEVGRRDEAVPVSKEAVALYRELAALNRNAHLPGLAAAVTNHALWLAEVGRPAEAVPLSKEAVALYRELAGLNRNAHLPGLASSINNHARALAQVGRRAEAVPVSEEAVALYRELAALNRDAYLPGLAAAVTNHAVRLAEVGRPAEAVPVSEEAVALYRELAALNRDAHLPGLADSLSNHALRLAEVGRPAEAVPVSEEAVTLYRELAALNRDAHLPGLADSLSNHAVRLAEVGRPAEAVPVSEEAVALRRELAALNRDAHLPGLANSLSNHAVRLAEVGRPAEAVPLSEEAVRLDRELAALNRDAYLPGLADSLSNHAYRLAEVGRPAEAVPLSEEAVKLRRELAGLNRDAYLLGLAGSLGNHATFLAKTGRWAEAVPVLEEAVALRRELAGLNQDAYLPGYVKSLATLGYVLIEDVRAREAVTFLTSAFFLGQQAQDLVGAVAHLLRRAYADDPAAVEEEFRTLTGQDLPSWITEQPASQE